MQSNKSWVAPSLLMLLAASLAANLPACSSDSSSAPDGSGGDVSSSYGGDGAAGSPLAAGGAEASGAAGEAGDSSTGGTGPAGDAGAGANPTADALPTTTFLYVYSQTEDTDLLVARDFDTGEERVVTDLRGDGSEGWEIWGHATSPDRRRIAIASLYDPTQADVDTDLATRRIWTFDTDGGDFQRLTPVFPNTGEGRTNFHIAVQDPVFSADGQSVIYDFGNWWYEGTTLEGGSLPWSVPTGGGLPELFPTVSTCTVVDPSVNPATGEVLLVHSVCVDAADEGLFLYPSTGGTEPTQLVARSYGAGGVDPSLDKASWLADGSGFLFIGTIEVTRGTETEAAKSLLSFDMGTGEVGVIVIPDPDSSVQSATLAPDGRGIVYCLAHEGGYDLRAIDLGAEPLEDVPLTQDGKSCYPSF